MDKLFIKSEDLLKDSFQLAWNVYKSGYAPNYIIGVWRGGAPIGIAVQEFLSFLDIKSCLLYTSPSPRDLARSRMPSSA